ncbi:MAG TPA: hypothetical protein PK819_12710, partial [Thermomicrobiales bacterium]|nr:hypothetical protein [Thermomicrobiales bacterium]
MNTRYGNKWAGTTMRLLAFLGVLFGLLGGLVTQVSAAGTATIVVTSVASDGVTPMPFARFQVLDSNGTILSIRESAPPDGIATMTIDLGDADETYTVTMETPPACAVQPEDQALGTLSDGDEVD